ncbi:heavy metal translocating P-type ATPase [Candidatus Entotheonella palauensis]|uniref:heavy metal translocating P-type ATPase n=1 Tax=Candidatus Entotheonella palauensis TaxID=93172 RepID=UPI0015C4787D|nr:heavy metal translocating P-type ATPase [Candidatus Entotheonella palauensis]
MIIPALLIVAGVRLCQKSRSPGQLPASSQPTAEPSSPPAPSWIEQVERLLDNFNLQETALAIGTKRQQQLRELDATLDKAALSPEERKINRRIMFAIGLAGLTITGTLGFPLLTLISVPILIYQAIPVARGGYDELVVQRKVGSQVIRTLFTGGGLALGYFWLSALDGVIFCSIEKLRFNVYNTSRGHLVRAIGEQFRAVWVQKGEVELEVPVEEVRVGDIVVVRAGEAIPVDGTITEGIASIDQHMLTGEAQPVEKSVGDAAFAATLILSGTIRVKVEKAGADTLVATIEDILQHTSDYTSALELKGKVISDKTVLPTLALSAVTLTVLGPTAALCTLSCHVGQGMRLLGPLSLLNFMNLAAKDDILVKDGRALEALQDVDTVVFDKTGTLTREQPHVVAIRPCASYTENEVLGYAAAAEAKQTHPLARAILQEAENRQLDLPLLDESAYEVGYGMRVEIAGHQIRVGSARFMEREGLLLSADLVQHQVDCYQRGYSVVYVAIDEAMGGAIELRPTIRPEAKRIIQRIRQRGLEVYILSGDHEEPTRQLAHDLGIEHYLAETLPEHKAKEIERLQGEGKSVCFVGDGINDAIALKKAHVSISLRGASTLASDTAQIILMDEGLQQLPRLFELADALERNMKGNLISLIAPTPILLAGLYLLNFRIYEMFVVGATGGIVCLTHAMWPAIYPPTTASD